MSPKATLNPEEPVDSVKGEMIGFRHRQRGCIVKSLFKPQGTADVPDIICALARYRDALGFAGHGASDPIIIVTREIDFRNPFG
tara:strand:- start:156 stop:407 length:252 start_codon:yes stop_codon:yes gene_type:complete